MIARKGLISSQTICSPYQMASPSQRTVLTCIVAITSLVLIGELVFLQSKQVSFFGRSSKNQFEDEKTFGEKVGEWYEQTCLLRK